MSFKVLITDTGVHPLGIRMLEAAAQVVDVPPSATEDEIAEAAKDVDAILARVCRISRRVILAAPKLKIVSRHGVGVDNVDVEECTRNGIAVAITEEATCQAVCEHTFACMLALANKVTAADREIRAGKWERHKWVGVELHGKTLGILGLGPIGSRTAKHAAAFEMEVIACDPYVEETAASELGVSLVDFETLLGRADFLSLHVPLTPETKGIIGPRELDSMKPSAILVNTCRGGVVDEKALHRALVDGGIAGAAIDVFEQEPVPADHPLLQLDNILCTPHIAGQSAESMVRMSQAAAENILCVLRGERPSQVVNPEVLQDRSRINWKTGKRD